MLPLIKPAQVRSPQDLERYALSRMAGFLDCLRLLGEQGLPDQAYVDYLVEKTQEAPVPLVDWLRERLRD